MACQQPQRRTTLPVGVCIAVGLFGLLAVALGLLSLGGLALALLVATLALGWVLVRHSWFERRERDLIAAREEIERSVDERMVALCQEIEQRKVSEAALAKSERRFREIFDQSIQLVAVADPQGILVDANRAALALINTDLREVVGRHISETAWWSHVPEEAHRLRTALTAAAHGVFVRYETTLNSADGSAHAVDFSLKPLKDDEGSVLLVILEGRDITELKHSERERLSLAAELHQSQRLEALGQLAGGVAHDFNNLLTVITGNLSRLEDGHTSDSTPGFDIRETLEATHRASELTRQLLALSRQKLVEPRVFSPAESLSGLRKLLPQVVGEEVSLKVSVMGDPGPLFLDPSQFDQIVMNLVVNARDAMPSGGQLDVTLSRIELEDPTSLPRGPDQAGTYILLTVSDTGTGIPESIVPQLFEPFFTTKAAGAGTGLGLTTVHGIVTQASGAIAVDSKPGWGTTFRVYLPSCDCPSPSSRRAAPANVEPLLTGTILLVEDQPTVRDLVVRLLNRHGLEVSAHSDGNAALEYAKVAEHHLDLILTDVVMPEMGGQSLAHALRQLRPLVPIVFMSGHIDAARLVEDLGSSREFFLAKPFTPNALVEKLRSILWLSRQKAVGSDV